MSIFEEDKGWENIAIDNADKGWTARAGCGICKINEDKVMVFGGYDDKLPKAGCYIMREVNNVAVIRQLPYELEQANNFSRLANCVIRGNKLYSLSLNRCLHVCNLKSKTWWAFT